MTEREYFTRCFDDCSETYPPEWDARHPICLRRCVTGWEQWQRDNRWWRRLIRNIACERKYGTVEQRRLVL